jgi:hypothetical protein
MESYNLYEKINLIYDYLYSNLQSSLQSSNLHSTYKIIDKNIKMNDIKLAYNNIIEENDEYNKIKKEILDAKLMFLDYNKSNNHFTFKRYSDTFSLLLKINFYKKNTINLMISPPNNDSYFSYLLSQLVLNKKTKHILLPLINIDIKVSDIIKYLPKSIDFNINDYHDVCCLQLREFFFRSISLKEYLKTNKCDYKILLFQIFHTLYTLQTEFKNFAHNKLTLDNIYIYQKKDSDTFTTYKINNNIYYIPNKEFDIKITNFEYSDMKSKKNTDIKDFCTDLMNIFNSKTDANNNDDITEKFLENIINNNLHIIDILKNKYFEEYLHKTHTMPIDYGSQIYLTNKIKSNLNIMEKKRLLRKDNNTKIHRIRYVSDNLIDLQSNNFSRGSVGKHRLLGGSALETLQKKEYETKPDLKYDTKPDVKYDTKQIILEQKIYDTKKPDPKPTYSPFIPMVNQFNNPYMQYPYQMTPNQPTINKIYNVSLSNPLGNYTVLNTINEDLMIGDGVNKYTFTTLFERIKINDYIYNMLIESHNGEYINQSNKKPLLQYIKLDTAPMPYLNKHKKSISSSGSNSQNDFLLYRAGYPIKLNVTTKQVEFTKDSIGMNIRIYRMKIIDNIYHNIMNKKDDLSNCSTLLKELYFYNYVRNNIIRKKVSPNFVCPILWKIDNDSTNIKWDEYKKSVNIPTSYDNSTHEKYAYNKKIITTNAVNSTMNPKKTLDNNNSSVKIDASNNIFEIDSSANTITIPPKTYTTINDLVTEINTDINIKIPGNTLTLKYENNKFTFNDTSKLITKIIFTNNLYLLFGLKNGDNDFDTTTNKLESCYPINFTSYNPVNIHEDTKDNMILITEAPNYSLLQWASPLYEKQGSVRKMIQSGFYDDEVWKSILFQIMYAFTVLHKHNIAIDNVNINNIYIKNIGTTGNTVSSWVYIIDNIEYYVPNYGYIVVIDTNNNDIINESTFDCDNFLTDLLNIINEQQFTRYFLANNANSVNPEIKTIIDNINKNISANKSKTNLFLENDKMFKDLFKTIFKEYFNNKVGRLLTKIEVDNLSPYGNSIDTNGLAVLGLNDGTFKWVMIIDKDNNKVNDGGKNEITININTLLKYPERVSPDPIGKRLFDENNINEIYNLDN